MARYGHYANPIKSATCDLPTVPRVWACKATFCGGVQDEGDNGGTYSSYGPEAPSGRRGRLDHSELPSPRHQFSFGRAEV